MVLDTARKVHRDLAAGDQPFALIVETVGPHGPKGCLSRRWTNSGKAEETHDISRVVESLVEEVMEFLSDIRAVRPVRGRDLRVVLLSDHLNHIARLPFAGAEHAGFNTVILWGDPARKGEVIDKPGSMIDVFPTLLDWLGWSEAPASAGLGRSLLSAPPTLVQEFGIAGVDAMIVGDARLSNLLWGQSPRLAERPVTA